MMLLGPFQLALIPGIIILTLTGGSTKKVFPYL